MQVLREPKCGPTRSGLEEQGSQVGSPGGAQSCSTPTVSSHQCHQHKALGSPYISHLRRQRVSTVYHGSLISIFLCLQMPILAAEELWVQGPCNPVMAILDEKTNLSCTLHFPENVTKKQEICSKIPDSPVIYKCKDGRDRPEKAMTEFAGLTVRRAGPEMCNGTWNLTFFANSWQSNCTFKNGNSSSVEQKVKGGEPIIMTVLMVSAVTVPLILLIPIGLCIKRNKLKNCCKNRSSKSQPSPGHRTSQFIQPSYVPAHNTDPEDDELHSIATDGNADATTATADTHDTVPGETSVSPTEVPYPSGTASMDTVLTADSESASVYDSEAHDSAYCDSFNSVSLAIEAYGSAVAAFLATEVKNEPLSKYNSQRSRWKCRSLP